MKRNALSESKGYPSVLLGVSVLGGTRKSIKSVLVGIFASIVVSGAQAQFVIDDWQMNHRLETSPALAAESINLSVSAASGTTILGGFRNVTVDKTANPTGNNRLSNTAGSGFASVNLESQVQGFSSIFWDGTNDASTLNPIGLRGGGAQGVNLLEGCGVEPASALVLFLNETDAAIDLTFEIYTDDVNWSSLTISTGPGGINQLIGFPYGDFVTQAGSGAQFDDVGAIRLRIEPPTSGDLTISFPLTNCGFDFGDAPENFEEGHYYTTTLAEKVDLSGFPDFIQNNTEGGPRHFFVNGGPFLGNGINDTDVEFDGQPNASATGDDLAGVDDEQAVSSFPAMGEEPGVCDGLENSGDSSLYCVAVEVSNPTVVDAQVVGWIDFSGGGVFSRAGCGTSANGAVIEDRAEVFAGMFAGTGWGCDRSAAGVRLGANGLRQIDTDASAPTCPAGSPAGTPIQDAVEIGGGTWTTGNVPANCEGTVVLVWDLSDATEVTTGETFARFRITTDTNLGTFFTEGGPEPFGEVGDGEVEDHRIAPGTIPVSISAFESRDTRGGLEVSWSTASETGNVGFYIWGRTRDGFDLLSPEMIASDATDAVTPQSYSVVLPGRSSRDVSDLVITAVDHEGREEMYGYFSIGDSFGRDNPTQEIDWDSIRYEAEARMGRIGYDLQGATWRRTARAARAVTVGADFQVTQPGMQRITYEDLVAAGFNLDGARPERIAVTRNGEAVPRIIVNPTPRQSLGRRMLSAVSDTGSRPAPFGPGSEILFWGELPQLPDALYTDHYNYRVEVDSSKVVNAGQRNGRSSNPASVYYASQRIADDVAYDFVNPNPDPWFMKRLRSNSSANNHFNASFDLGDDVILERDGSVSIRIAGATDFPASPNHRVLIEVNGTIVEDFTFDGLTSHYISANVPAGLLQAGQNTVSVRSPGVSGVLSIKFLDSIELNYPVPAVADNGRLLVQNAPGAADGFDGLLLDGFTSAGDVQVFAWNGGSLYQVQSATTGRGGVVIPGSRDDGFAYWASTAADFNRPEFAGHVEWADLTANLGEFVVIAHPAFLPTSPRENHPLNQFVQHRQAQGWDVSLVDLSDIQIHFGGGMPLPSAITRFLQSADGVSHVLLVGGDSSDYRDINGWGSISFIPTVYAATQVVNHTPSDGLLTDLNGDGVSQLPIGRWPVRTLADLSATVQKVFDWESNVAPLASSVWLTDEMDPRMSSFAGQAERMNQFLTQAGWPAEANEVLLFEDFVGLPGGPVLNARQALFDAIESGSTLTGFTGHGSPTVWSFQSILTPNDVAGLFNEGMPTLVSTLACYTSYFVSPSSHSLAHRLMNGYALDSAGNPIPGAPNGAVAIHGAATLSSLGQNEVFMRRVLEAQFDGATLGEAIQAARVYAAERRINDLVINWTLLGDPTLRLQ